MCGIVGYTGGQQAAPILLDGLSKLEYRGYDSSGIAIRNGEKDPEIVKAKGRLRVLEEKTNGGTAIYGTCGLGHTRWATHGEPSEINAHPHASDHMDVVAVHNGIIENYQELKDKLLRKGYTFYSETDTEVAVKLIDYYYKKYQVGPIDSLAKSMVRIRGSYALAVMFKDYPGEIYAARKDSPMVIGVTDGETFLASDVPAILKYTRQIHYIENLEMARLTEGDYTVFPTKKLPIFISASEIIIFKQFFNPLARLFYQMMIRSRGIDSDHNRPILYNRRKLKVTLLRIRTDIHRNLPRMTERADAGIQSGVIGCCQHKILLV